MRDKKVSINITQDEYDVLERLAQRERRSVSELASLIVVDNSIQLLRKGSLTPSYCPIVKQGE